ncbi:VOC family protein [Gramella sp. KN1008]|uniref:VOC family protein n=1 Tax=Gramella sp. KN1008 TaxID=2529298 RepID=UPI00103B724B|nr:VOC family protein [Gramella sp. KN1008]TBW29173.1 VOC family protein [Gramella sp. KN1008]
MKGLSEAFSTYSVNDLKMAKKFYEDTLGLDVTENEMGLLELKMANCQVLIYPKPDHKPANFTVLNFKVKNLERQVDTLRVKGVIFEQYDNDQIKTDPKGIHSSKHGPRIAWFMDPAGNILSLIEEK